MISPRKRRWNCPTCLEADLRLREGRAIYCVDCNRARALYRTTQSNLRSGFNRTNKGSCTLDIDIDEFSRWRKSQPQQCRYCGISEIQLLQVGMKSQIQRPVKVMGVDRQDSSRGYVVDNLVPCCFVCNQVKGDRFTADEMAMIGPGIGDVWRGRLVRGGANMALKNASEEVASGPVDGQVVDKNVATEPTLGLV